MAAEAADEAPFSVLKHDLVLVMTTSLTDDGWPYSLECGCFCCLMTVVVVVALGLVSLDCVGEDEDELMGDVDEDDVADEADDDSEINGTVATLFKLVVFEVIRVFI